MNKSNANKNTEDAKKKGNWRALQKRRKKDQLRKSVQRSQDAELRKKELDDNRKRNAARRANNPDLREKELEVNRKWKAEQRAINPDFRKKEQKDDRIRTAERRANNPDFRKKEQEDDRIRTAERRANNPDLRKKELEGNRIRNARQRKEEWDKKMAHQADFSTPPLTCLEDEDDLNYDDFEQNPETAAMLLHWNSGLCQWSNLDLLVRYNSDPRIRRLVREVELHCKYYKTELRSYRRKRDKIAGMLLDMKRARPGYVFYKICWRVWTESVSLQFILNGKDPKPQEHIIGVEPDGFYYAELAQESPDKWGRKLRMYPDLNQLLGYFETNPLDPEGFIYRVGLRVKVVSLWERMKEVMHHHKFVHEHEDNVDKKLMGMKSGSPKGVFYSICWFGNEDYYAKFSLRFIVGNEPKFHTIVIALAGFVWGTKTYCCLKHLLEDFEQDPQDGSCTKWMSEDVCDRFKKVSVSSLFSS